MSIMKKPFTSMECIERQDKAIKGAKNFVAAYSISGCGSFSGKSEYNHISSPLYLSAFPIRVGDGTEVVCWVNSAYDRHEVKKNPQLYASVEQSVCSRAEYLAELLNDGLKYRELMKNNETPK